jgi:plastocyanin
VTNTFQCCNYSQPCIKIKVGTKVAWTGDFASHPLSPFKTFGTQPNPIVETSSGGSAEVTFSTAGEYGYYCSFHGSEALLSGGMCGGIFVVP